MKAGRWLIGVMAACSACRCSSTPSAAPTDAGSDAFAQHQPDAGSNDTTDNDGGVGSDAETDGAVGGYAGPPPNPFVGTWNQSRTRRRHVAQGSPPIPPRPSAR